MQETNALDLFVFYTHLGGNFYTECHWDQKNVSSYVYSMHYKNNNRNVFIFIYLKYLFENMLFYSILLLRNCALN